MSEQHTPGPWNIRRLAGIPGVVVGGVVRKHPTGSSQDQLFTVCGCRDDNGGDEAQEANARLIAAAPDLLEALRSVWLWMEDQADGQSKGGHATFDLMMLREQRDIARDAISKATGETK